MTTSSRFALHVDRWRACTACDLHKGRRKVVLARGTVPCDVLLVGEAPGECITGDSLVETAFRDKRNYPRGVPIKDLVGKAGIQVYSYDLEQSKLAVGNVKRVWKTGYKRVYEVSYFWWGAPPNGKGGRHKYYGSIKVTDNHPFLLKSGEYRSIRQGLEVGNRLQPFYRFCGGRRYRVGTYSGAMKKEAVLLLEEKLGRPLESGEQCHHDDRNPENDSWDNLVLLDIAEHARLHGLEDNAMFDPVHRETHRRVMDSDEYRSKMSRKMKQVLADPENRRKRLAQIQKQRQQTSETVKKQFATDPIYYYRYLLGRAKMSFKWTEERIRRKMAERFPDVPYPPEDNHEVYRIKFKGMEEVYDMEVEKYHNFAVNGIFVHNSEDTLGRPFVGPAGRLLDEMLGRALRAAPKPSGGAYTWAMTNIVACIPREADGSKTAEPDDDCVEACAPRLAEFAAICDPKLVVAVGSLARDWLDPKYKRSVRFHRRLPTVDIIHPAAILRANVAMQGLMIQRAVVALTNALESIHLL